MASRAVRLLVYSRFNPSGHWSGAPQPLTNQRLCWKSADLATAWTPNSDFSSLSLSVLSLRLSLLSTLGTCWRSVPIPVPKREPDSDLAGEHTHTHKKKGW